ncbi:HNH endonuclease [Novosphingobium sp.]|uniref:HNH endonuclease n=1 Tax=Novosphingobium sp. TaxID=1874826 RepID=UPI003BAD6758
MQFDHVLPNSRGGSSDLDNMAITCAPCNFGRMEYTLEEARLSDPRLEFRRDTWDGYGQWDGLRLLHA